MLLRVVYKTVKAYCGILIKTFSALPNILYCSHSNLHVKHNNMSAQICIPLLHVTYHNIIYLI